MSSYGMTPAGKVADFLLNKKDEFSFFMSVHVEDAAQAPYRLRTQRRIQFDDKTLSMGTFERFH